VSERELPSNVARFEQLMYLSLAIGLINATLTWDHNVAQASKLGGAYFVLFIQMFVISFIVLFIWLVARRYKNWARWVLLVLFVLGMPGTVGVVRQWFRLEPVVGVLNLVQILIQVIALVYVFTGNARDWFKPMAVPVQG
jgi:hypothetical protein